MSNHLEISNLVSYDVTECSKDWNVEETYSQTHRFYYVYSGEALYVSRDEKFYLQKNTLYLFPVFREYKITHNPNLPLHCLWFHINLNCTLLNNTAVFSVHTDTARFHIIKTLESLILEKASAYTVKSTLNTLLLLLEHNEQLTYVSDQRLDKVLQHIHNNYDSCLSNLQLANLINLDHRYFIRLFRKNYGRTPQEYISIYRAIQAANLILKGMQIKEVAKKSGFEDTKSFSRFFKSMRGMSPSEYKKCYYLQP